MIAFVEERRSGERWLVVLDESGDLIHSRRVEGAPKVQGLAPIVSKEQYDADRQIASKPADAKIDEQFENTGTVVKLPWPRPSTPQLAAKRASRSPSRS